MKSLVPFTKQFSSISPWNLTSVIGSSHRQKAHPAKKHLRIYRKRPRQTDTLTHAA